LRSRTKSRNTSSVRSSTTSIFLPRDVPRGVLRSRLRAERSSSSRLALSSSFAMPEADPSCACMASTSRTRTKARLSRYAACADTSSFGLSTNYRSARAVMQGMGSRQTPLFNTTSSDSYSKSHARHLLFRMISPDAHSKCRRLKPARKVGVSSSSETRAAPTSRRSSPRSARCASPRGSNGARSRAGHRTLPPPFREFREFARCTWGAPGRADGLGATPSLIHRAHQRRSERPQPTHRWSRENGAPNAGTSVEGGFDARALCGWMQ
jgi:hypothetical protein